MAAGVGDGSWSIWEIAVSLMSGGAVTSFLALIYWFGGKASQIDELQARFADQEKALKAFTEKSDARHEANIEAIHRVTTAVASVPSKQDFQRLEDQIGRRMTETETQLRVSMAEFKQMLFRASRDRDSSQ
jgi:hypothetical protein